MIVWSRPNLQIVFGKITSIDNNFITIEDTVANKKVYFKIRPLKNNNFVFRTGINIVATIKPTTDTLNYEKGIEFKKEYEVEAYNIRYSGSFDFDARNNVKEEHVFYGTIMEIKPLSDGGNRIIVTWKKGGEAQYALLYSPPSIALKGNNNKGLFITGEGKACKNNVLAYIVKKAI